MEPAAPSPLPSSVHHSIRVTNPSIHPPIHPRPFIHALLHSPSSPHDQSHLCEHLPFHGSLSRRWRPPDSSSGACMRAPERASSPVDVKTECRPHLPRLHLIYLDDSGHSISRSATAVASPFSNQGLINSSVGLQSSV